MTDTEFLPPLYPLGPLRISCERLDGHPAYATLLAEAATTGCCPVWVAEPQYLSPPDDPHAAVAATDRIDPAEFLAEHWTPNCPLCGCRDPFGNTFPGLVPARGVLDD
ncbi:MAG: hypothetical protein H7Y15_11420, partial [Pseudonocardia sp.]|nr:hypothetical protein [Pseudonocardia sp.]